MRIDLEFLGSLSILLGFLNRERLHFPVPSDFFLANPQTRTSQVFLSLSLTQDTNIYKLLIGNEHVTETIYWDK